MLTTNKNILDQNELNKNSRFFSPDFGKIGKI